MPPTQAELFLAKLQGVKPTKEGRWQAHCPAHDDRAASLSIAIGEGGRILVHCHAGCALADVLAAAGVASSDLFPPRPRKARGEIVATYDYTDANGTLLFQACRFAPKDFRQRRPDGAGGWVWRLDDTPRVLYRLPDLTAADPAIWVFVVEGEKDANNLARAGLVATTNPMGAGKWAKLSDDSVLEGRRVCILPDRDDAGRRHAQDVAIRLYGRAAEVKVLELSGEGVKDATDWLGARGTQASVELRQTLLGLAEAAPAWTPPPLPRPELGVDAFDLNDDGNAQLIIALHGEKLRYLHDRQQWVVFRPGLWWEEDVCEERVALAFDAARWRQREAGRLADARRGESHFKWAIRSRDHTRATKGLLAACPVSGNRPTLGCTGREWDAEPMLLGVANGVVNLATGELRPGKPDDRITMHTDVSFDPTAECPLWEQALSDIFLGSHELADFLWRCVGYSLSGSVREQCIFLLVGAGSNGKSLLLQVLRHVLGPFAVTVPFRMFEARSRNDIPSDVALTRGARLVSASETCDGKRFDESRLKSLSGGDAVTARKMYQDFETWEPTAKIWLSVNHRPIVKDDSYAFWRRMRVVPFDATFVPIAKANANDLIADPDLAEKLKVEAQGILAWAIRGCLDWQAHGLDPPGAVEGAVADYQMESDPLAAFVEAKCVVAANCFVLSKSLYLAYGEWADEEGVPLRDRLTHTAFGRRLRARFSKGRSPNGRITYLGIGLRRADNE